MNPKKFREYIAIPKKERQISLILIVLLNCLSLYYFINQSPNITNIDIVEKKEIVVDNQSDFKKDYTSKKKQYLNSTYSKTENTNFSNEHEVDSTRYSERPEKKINIELNSCSREELMELRGIGEKLSTRIIKYRDLLGGFTSVNQLKEVYGIKPEVFDGIEPSLTIEIPSSKINLNQADFKTLIRHPYMDKSIVKSILNYKKVHGEFKSVEDLKLIYSISDSIFVKIEPYLIVE